MVIGNPHTSLIILNANGMNSPIERHRVADWIKKQNPTTCCLHKTHLSCNYKDRLKVIGWKMIPQAKGIYTKASVVILISDKIDFEITNVT